MPVAIGLVWLAANIVIGLQPTMYKADAVAVVPVLEGADLQRGAFDATRIAESYAELIPSEITLLSKVAADVDVPVEDIEDGLDVTNVENTAILRFELSLRDRKKVVPALNALLAALTDDQPVASGIVPGSIAVAKPPVSPEASRTSTSTFAVIVLALGLALGIVVIIAWERADLRVEDPEFLTSVTGVPASSPGSMSAASLAALADRWWVLAGNWEPVAGLVGVSVGLGPITQAAAAHIARSCAEQGRPVDLRYAPIGGTLTPRTDSPAAGGNYDMHTLDSIRHATPGRMLLIAGGSVDGSEAGESVAMCCAVTVLVVPVGTRVTRLKSAIAQLAEYGVQPQWALMVHKRRLLAGTTVPEAGGQFEMREQRAVPSSGPYGGHQSAV